MVLARTLEWYRFRLLSPLGYDFTQWIRVEQRRTWREKIESLNPTNLDACEISPQGQPIWASGWRSYTAKQYPDFDVCSPPPETEQYDVVILDQVLEHVPAPGIAAQNIRAMLRDGGIAFIGTPFLIRVHASPFDFSRWTESGLSMLLHGAGFRSIETGSWGNRAAVRANLGSGWPEFGWGRPMKNEPNFPVVVWAFAQK